MLVKIDCCVLFLNRGGEFKRVGVAVCGARRRSLYSFRQLFDVAVRAAAVTMIVSVGVEMQAGIGIVVEGAGDFSGII